MAKSIAAQAQAAMNKAMEVHPLVKYAGSNEEHNIKVWFVAGHAGDYCVYEQEGLMHCTCEAGGRGIICYHRAAVRLAQIQQDAGKAFCQALDASIAQREAYEDAQVAPKPIREDMPMHFYFSASGLPLKAS